MPVGCVNTTTLLSPAQCRQSPVFVRRPKSNAARHIKIRSVNFRALPAWRLPTDEELSKISIGDDIVSAGMLLELRNTQKNYPVFKFGKISNILKEDIQTGCGGPQFPVRAWLIAANLVPGNSGSPIFYYPPFGENGDISSPGLQRMVLIGVQSSSALPSDVAFMTQAQILPKMRPTRHWKTCLSDQSQTSLVPYNIRWRDLKSSLQASVSNRFEVTTHDALPMGSGFEK